MVHIIQIIGHINVNKKDGDPEGIIIDYFDFHGGSGWADVTVYCKEKIKNNDAVEPTSGTSYTYTGTTQNCPTFANTTLSGTTSATDVGTYTATATPVSGHSWPNGDMGEKAFTWSITPKQISATWGDPTTFTYDKQGHAPTVTTPVNGVNNEIVNIERTTEINQGSYISIASIKSVEGGQAKVSNYTLSNNTQEFSINAKSMFSDSVSISALSEDTFTYDGTEKKPTVTITDSENSVSTLVEGTDYTITYENHINAGNSNEAKATITGIGNYGGEVVKTFTINKRPVTVKVDENQGKVYGENNPTLTATKDGVVSGDTLNYTIERTTGENAGTYPITITLGENPNYDVTKTDGTFTIERKPINVRIEIPNNQYKYVAGGNEPVVTVYNIADDSEVSLSEYNVTYSNNTSVGTATIEVTDNGTGNYIVANAEKNFTIINGDITDEILKFEDLEIPYDGDEHSINIEGYGLLGGIIEYSTDGINYSETLPIYANVGEYTIYYKASKDNYNDKTGSATLTITKKPITVTVTDKESVYGDTIADLAYSVTSGNVVNGDNLGITYKTYNGETEVILGTTTAAGTYTIKAASTNTNYNVTFVNGTYTINKKAVTPVVTLSQDTFTYNKEEQKPTVYVKVGNADLPTDEYTKVFTTDSTNVGSKKVTITSKNQNYTFDPIEKNYVINAKSIDSSMVTIEDSQYVFDNTTKTPTVTLTNGDYTLVKDIDYEVLSTSTTSATNSGNYSIIVKGKGNYKDEYTIPWTITKAAIQGVTINGVNTVYDGTDKEIDVTIPTGAKITYKTNAQDDYSETKPTFKDAVNYTVYYKIEIDNNYIVIENSVPVIITPKDVTVTADDKEKVYGEEDEELTYTAEGLIENETLEGITLSREVGEDVGEYTITTTKNTTKDTNYNIITQNGTYTINKKTITEEEIKEMVTIENQVYTKEKVEPEIVIKDEDEIVPNTEYTVKYSDNVQPGIAKVTIKNAEGGNYIIETTELTFVIIEPGVISFTEPETPNSNNAKVIESAEEIISKIELTDDDVDKMKHGKNIEIYLEVKDISDSVSKTDKKAIEEKLGKETLGMYLDISLFKKIGGEDETKITETKEPITISFEIPDELINNNSKVERTYKVLALHDGVVREIEIKVNGKTATFETDKFSTYALTYTDISLETSSSPKTGDNITMYVMIFIISLLGIGTLSVSNKRKI